MDIKTTDENWNVILVDYDSLKEAKRAKVGNMHKIMKASIVLGKSEGSDTYDLILKNRYGKTGKIV